MFSDMSSYQYLIVSQITVQRKLRVDIKYKDVNIIDWNAY